MQAKMNLASSASTTTSTRMIVFAEKLTAVMQATKSQFSSPANGAAAPTTSTMTQDRTLQFVDLSLEEEFMRYIHPVPVTFLPVLYGINGVFYLLFALSQPELYFEFVGGPFLIICALNVVTNRLFYLRRNRDRFLWLERGFVVFAVMLSIVFDQIVTMRFIRSNCTLTEFPPIAGDSATYREANCQRWINTSGVVALAAGSAIQIMTFRVIVSTAAAMIASHFAMAGFILPAPDLGFHVFITAAFLAISGAFVAFTRYEQEKQQRLLFLAKRELELHRAMLSEKEAHLNKYCAVVLPDGLLRRILRLGASATVDESAKGTVCMCKIHDYSVWCTQRRPLDAATAVIQLQTLVRMSMRGGVEYIGSMGDMVLCIGGLLVEDRTAAAAAVNIAAELLAGALIDELPPLQTVVHVGPLQGCFAGSLVARYDVHGRSVEQAQVALVMCGQNMCAISVAAAEQIGTPELNMSTEGRSDAETFVVGDSARFVCQTVDDIPQIQLIEDSSGAAQNDTSSSLVSLADALALAFDDKKKHSQYAKKARSNVVVGAERSSDGSVTNDSFSSGHTELHALRQRLESYRSDRSVWCCYREFNDDEVESVFVEQRIAALKGAGCRTWLSYASYTLGIFVILMLDFQGPSAVGGAVMITLAAVLSVAIGVFPRMVSPETTKRYFFAWSVAGIVVPLFLVYGSAIARPSAVGNDVLIFPQVGTLVRAYCFSSARYQAVGVLLSTIAGFGQFALPGSVFRVMVFTNLVILACLVGAEGQRDREARENLRRKVELELVVAELKSAETLRIALLKSILPRQILELVRRQRLVSQTDSTAAQTDGVVMVVKVPTVTEAAALSGPDKLKGRFDLLEEALAKVQHMSLASVVGDQAVVVGPPSLTEITSEQLQLALREAVPMALALGEAEPPFAVVLDTDTIIHALMHGDFAQYWALGVSVTRMLTVMTSADDASLRGCHVTERVLPVANEMKLLDNVSTSPTGPLKIRGAGMLRFIRLKSTDS